MVTEITVMETMRKYRLKNRIPVLNVKIDKCNKMY